MGKGNVDMLEEKEEQKIERLVRLMFEAELYSMEYQEKEQEPVIFSEAFEEKMERLIRKQRVKGQIQTAAKYVLSAVAVLLIILCLINPGYIAKAWDVLIKWHSTHLEVDMPDAGQTGPVPEYEMTYVPEGFEVVMEYYYEGGGVILYSEDENEISLMYSIGDGNYNYDNERSEISVKRDDEGNEVLIVKFEDGNYSMLWKTKDGITFSLDADVTEEESFKIKDGIKLKK